ncbi:MAG: hypothetical protein ACPL7R_04435, partial [Anaerolineae bacterium]
PPTPKATRTPHTTAIPSPAATQPPSAPSPGFAFGVEYMLPGGLAAVYSQLGARWARSNTSKQFSWGTIEPKPPAADGQHTYDWAEADQIIAEWQNAGFHIQVYTNANNTWASSTRLHHVPDLEYMDDYEAFVFSLVERYDGDGDRDMPGLKFPVLHYTVVEEWTGYFEGTAEDYLRILAAAHRAIKRANPQALVGLVDFFLIDVFDGNPSPEEVERRAAKDHPLRHPMSEVRELLRHPDLFDRVEIHALGDYTELYPTMAWLRAEMRKNGYEKPVWIGDALPVSSLLMPITPRGLLPGAADSDYQTVTPIRPQDAVRTIGWLEAVGNAKSPQHQVAERWWRAVQAMELVKKIVIAIHAGYAGMNLAWLVESPLTRTPRITGSWGFQGMADAEYNFLTQTWSVNSLQPAFYAYQLTIRKLEGYAAVERLDVGGDVYAYRFTVRRRPVYVLWHEPGRLYFLDEAEPASASVNLPVEFAQAVVTHTITRIGQTEPDTETIAAQDGILTLSLGPAPVFVEGR